MELFSYAEISRMLADPIKAFLLNIIITFFIALIFFALGLIWSKLGSLLKREQKKFKMFFGNNIRDVSNIYIVADTFYLRPDIRNITQFLKDHHANFPASDEEIPKLGNFPFLKSLADRNPWLLGGVNLLLNFRTLKAITYLNSLVSSLFGGSPQIVRDDEGHSNWGNGTFFCIGSPASNMMSLHILDKTPLVKVNNEGIKIGDNFHVNIKKDTSYQPHYDYAIIFKANNIYGDGYSLVILAGLGEWGTSAAAKYLCKNWKKLYSKYKSKNFVIALQVVPLSDDATDVIYWSGEYNRLSEMWNIVKSNKIVKLIMGKTKTTNETPSSNLPSASLTRYDEVQDVKNESVSTLTPSVTGEVKENVSK